MAQNDPLDNLASTGLLHRAWPAREEIAGLLRTGAIRLEDALKTGLIFVSIGRVPVRLLGEEPSTMTHSKTTHVLLWTLQILLAALFIFSGIMKFMMPAEQLTAQSPFSAGFIRLIGALEILGGLGLILPGLTRIKTGLTPLAAAGLTIIMIGATVSTIPLGPIVALPLAVCLLVAFVAWGRWRIAPLRNR